MVDIIWVAYASWSLTTHEHNYHSTKQEFLAWKWVIAEQFQEHLLWKLFIVKTNNNLLTYMMTTPILDATRHQGWSQLHDSCLVLNTRMGMTMQPQTPWDVSPQSWMQKPWGPFWMGLQWEQPRGQMLITQWWLKLTKKYASPSRKLWLWLVLHVQTYIWLTGWLPNRRIKQSRPQSSGSQAKKCRISNTHWETVQILKRVRLFSESRRS